jgi:two-component system CheB/CheR fusion protein
VNSGNQPPILKVVWEEKGGPPAKQPRKSGFGTALLENGIPGATVNREFAPKGVICVIELPLRETTGPPHSEAAENESSGKG